jgi:hypothetical protein
MDQIPGRLEGVEIPLTRPDLVQPPGKQKIMKSFSQFTLAAALALVATARADDPKSDAPPDPCVTDLTLEKLDNPPERKTKYEVSKDVMKVKLQEIKLIDQKYVASFVIALPQSLRGTNGLSQYLRDDKELTALQQVLGRPFLTPDIFYGQYFGGEYKPLGQIIAQIPPRRLPAKEELEFFDSPKITQFVIFPTASETSSAGVEARFQMFVKTPEQAETRTRTLLMILDQGFSRPLQVGLFKERIKHCSSLTEINEKLPAAFASVEKLSAMLNNYEEYTPDLLAGLRVQQLQMEVDLAGVKARISACDKLLANKDAGKERLRQIEDAKVAAEIELAGFEARRAKSAEFVAKVKERNELTSQHLKVSTMASTLRQQRDRLIKSIKGIDEEIAAFAPVTLVDDRVTIHPLEWTQ